MNMTHSFGEFQPIDETFSFGALTVNQHFFIFIQLKINKI
jgi:hypothetical protein